MQEALEIDGSQGEGGGQIVRSSLALSLVTGKPVRIENIRAGREKSGLMRQHLTAVLAAAQVGEARVTGAEIGSCSLSFEPQAVKPGRYHFSVGTAGSATLVLQTVLPALMIADASSELTLEGGTHNQWAPPFDFLQKAYLPLVNRMGPHVVARLERHGFYPAGGGKFTVSITPSQSLKGFELQERGAFRSHSVCALLSNLPEAIATREIERVLKKLTWEADAARAERVNAHGPGNVLYAELAYDNATEVFTAFGRTGASAEQVADELVAQIREFLAKDVCVGPYLADQLMLPFGISAWQKDRFAERRGGSFRTLPLTRHSTTHIEILKRFLGVEIQAEQDNDGICLVKVS